jgi:hypothetical protein
MVVMGYREEKRKHSHNLNLVQDLTPQAPIIVDRGHGYSDASLETNEMSWRRSCLTKPLQSATMILASPLLIKKGVQTSKYKIQ